VKFVQRRRKMREPKIRKHKDGRWGLYIGENLLGIANTEVRAEIGLRLLVSAFEDRFAAGYDDGHTDGYDEGFTDAEMERE
jgi:hypothetical protein